MVHRSVSEPSIGASTIVTNATSQASRVNAHPQTSKTDTPRGSFLFKGRVGRITRIILLAPSNNVWIQSLVLLSIIYAYIVHFIVAYYIDQPILSLDLTLYCCELIFAADVFVNLLHAFWPLVRLHIRVYRRNFIALMFDVVTLLPLILAFRGLMQYEKWVLAGRWLVILRVYRIVTVFGRLHGDIRTSRIIAYLLEHMLITALLLHGSSCLWYAIHRNTDNVHYWYGLGYPANVNSKRLLFSSYAECWYYCTCRFFNVIFGDSFPLQHSEKWLTSVLMVIGYVFFRYKFIGTIAWEIILTNNRRANFVDRYHHMMSYLKLHGTPSWLVEQAERYKLRLWKIKDGILSSDQLQKLPTSLQMELIFDLNVRHLHSSLLFRETEEAFMRQVSLLMRHELFLAGQHIWSQGVVKSGMICIKRGVIEMLSDEDDESPVIAFKEGTVLGELSLFYSIPSKVTVKAATYVELQVNMLNTGIFYGLNIN